MLDGLRVDLTKFPPKESQRQLTRVLNHNNNDTNSPSSSTTPLLPRITESDAIASPTTGAQESQTTSNAVANSVPANGVATNGVATIISSLPRWSLNDPLARATNPNSAQNNSNASTATTPQPRLEAEVAQPPKPSPARVAPPPPPPPQAPPPPTQPTPPTSAQPTTQQAVEEEPLPNGWEIRFDTFGRFVLFFTSYLLSLVMISPIIASISLFSSLSQNINLISLSL